MIFGWRWTKVKLRAGMSLMRTTEEAFMKFVFGLAILGCAALAAIPASASNTNFNFLNGPSNSDLSSPYTTASTTGNGVNATVTAYFVQGTGSGPTGSDTMQTAEVGSYPTAGFGICETQNN